MELLQLRYFNETVLTGNFSHTAKKFGVPQSAVSQSVKRLENELGVELFNRTANRIELNECGKILFNRTRYIFLHLDEGLEELKKYNADTKGTINILIENNRRFITECIAEFKAQYPYVDFTIYHQPPLDEKIKFDFRISSNTASDSTLDKVPIITEDIFLSLSKSHPLAKEKSIDIESLKELPIISTQPGSNLHLTLLDIFSQNQIHPNITIFCDDPYYVRKYTAMGLGVSLFPTFSWKGLADDNVANIPFCNIAPKRTTYLFYKKNINHNPIAVLFKEFILLKAKY